MSGTKSDAANLTARGGGSTSTDNSPVGRETLLDDFWKSYVDSGFSRPYNGAGQLVNAVSHSISGKDALSYAPYLAAPKADLGFAGKTAEFVGQVAGVATDIGLLSLALRTGAEPFLQRGTTAESVSLFGKTMRPATLATLEATTTGAMYQGIFQPSAEGNNLFADRLTGAAIGGSTFGALTWLGQAAAPIVTRYFVPSMSTRVAAGELGGTTARGIITTAARAADDATATGAERTATQTVDGATAGSDPIGVAYMDGTRTLNVRMRLESEGTTGDIHLQYPPKHPQYKQLMQFLGNLCRDEGVQLTNWPFLPGGGVKPPEG